MCLIKLSVLSGIAHSGPCCISVNFTLTKHALEELDKLTDARASFDGSVIRKTCEGLPFVEIIRYVKEINIDLIIMGTHGRTGLMHIITGSVAENVVRRAPCLVLTVHLNDYQFVLP